MQSIVREVRRPVIASLARCVASDIDRAWEAVKDAETVITMLPAGEHVRAVYGSDGGLIANVSNGTLLIDCSTIDVENARLVATEAAERDLDMLDAPVSGGVAGAEAG